ncbi:hypothetical protein N0V93_000226 [Gnomoniopsis smithogilvyi]|uniref:F-box domain-containing protein n=1 Tax=Gnomoniopsis smithogilvyi TaxID=1191159 RepID=A0A9W8Z1W4_9PEZI|nr:hypothetical protein N0V93_000226 [Gnomoniopsis smithogilvyi]
MSTASHQEVALRHGEALYAQGKLDDAFGAFRKVILLCSCNKPLRASSKRLGISSKDIPLPICHCKDYLSLPINDPDSSFTDKEAILRLATRPCSCGSGIEPCHSASHIKALINIANVYVTQKIYNKAIQYASLAITLAPHLPEGYLRMVTVIRQGSIKCTPDIASRCNWLDIQASHIVRTHGDKDNQMLKSIGRRIRRDIVRGVPAEIRQMIFLHLSHTDVCRAMRVCKAWKVICRDRQLWKDLRLVKNWRHTKGRPPLRPGTLNNIIKLSGNMATSLTIDGLWDFLLDGVKLRALLKALPELRKLSLSGSQGLTPSDGAYSTRSPGTPKFSDFWTAIWENAPSTLVTLHLSSFDIEGRSQDPPPILGNCRFKNSLKELSLVRMHLFNACLVKECNMSEFASIDTLTIQECRSVHGQQLTLGEFLPNYTYLRSLTLDGVWIRAGSKTATQLHWDSLQRLVLGRFSSSHVKIPTSKILRSLELNHDGLYSLNYLRGREKTEKPFLPALQHFRCHFDPHRPNAHLLEHTPNVPTLVQPIDQLGVIHTLLGILRPSIENNTLQSLDLTFCNEVKAAVDALLTERPEENRKQAIHTLSCHGLDMPSIVTGFGGTCDEFLDWVDTFPNLTTVGAYPQKSENAYKLILWLMKKRPDVKTIYTNILKGAERDMVLAEAKKRRITVIHADRVPEPLLERR